MPYIALFLEKELSKFWSTVGSTSHLSQMPAHYYLHILCM